MTSTCFINSNSTAAREQALLDILKSTAASDSALNELWRLIEESREAVPLLSLHCQQNNDLAFRPSTPLQRLIHCAASRGSAEAITEALIGVADSGASIPGPQLHSILVQSLLQEPLLENAELQAVVAKFKEHTSLTFLPLLNSQESASPRRHVPALSMAGGNSLAGIVEDLGYGCTQNGAAFQDVLSQINSVNEADIASMLGMMLRTHATLNDVHGTQASLNNALGLPDSSEGKTWNVEIAVEVLKSFAPDLQPLRVIEALDHTGFHVADQEGLQLLMKAWKKLTTEPFPLQTVVGSVWQNSGGQLSLLRQAVTAPPEVFTFAHAENRMPPLEGLQGGKSATGVPNQCWLCLNLYNTLCRLAEVGHHSEVQQLLEQPMKSCPEVLFVGMASFNLEWGVLQHEVCQALALDFVATPQPNVSSVLRLVWPKSNSSILRAMLALYDQDHKRLDRVLEVCLEIGVLGAVLESSPFPFAIELASLAASEGLINLETWLQEQTGYHSIPFLAAVIQFVANKLQSYSDQAGDATQGRLPLDIIALHLRVLQAHSQGGPAELAAEVSQLQHHAVRVHPELQVTIIEAAAAASTTPAPATESFPADIEEEANMYFQKLYSSEDPETVESLTAKLRNMKTSSNRREQEIFPCMIQSLFDEYRFFHKYPDKELHITAELFGNLINSDLITGQRLGDALRLFLEAVRNPPGHKMCTFGIQALRPIMDRLPAWPQYCRNLLQVANLAERDKQLGEVAERASREIEAGELRAAPPGFEQAALNKAEAQAQPETGVQLAEDVLAVPGQQPRTPSGPLNQAATIPRSPRQASADGQPTGVEPRKTEAGQAGVESSPFGIPAVQGATAAAATALSGSPRMTGSGTAQPARSNASQTAMDHKRAFQAVNAETLEIALQDINYELPPHKIQDRIGFLINNLSNSNLKQKAGELKGHLTEEYWPWFCNYMVVKRAAQEQNYHLLYASLLQELQLKDLWRMLVATTYKYVKILLASERIKTHTSERSLLKNLGSWLGRVTIAQGQPVRHKDLDIKGIIIEAFEQGKMIAVLPFVNKVLEPCKDSKVFRPPNPWITGILSLMAEIYATDKLKLNLTFEIEMLFRNFSLQISDTRVSKELQHRKRDLTSATDFTVDKTIAEQSAPAGLPPPSPARSIPGLQEASAPATPAPPSHFSMPTTPARSSIDGAAEMRSQTTPQQTQPGPATQQSTPQDQGLIGNYHNHVSINPSLQYLAERLNLKRMVPVAVDRAVADIITPVVERSVTIACMTTQELILKDYALEENEGSMRKAAHLMVSSLAGSLALVTCREPLRSSLATQLRHLLTGTMDASQLDQTVNTITNDNFELGCTIIERSATDKAIRDINERLGAAFQARQKAAAAGQSYFDASVLQGRFPKSLPEALRPKAGHLTVQQERVYEDFARIPKQPLAAAAATGPSSLQSGGPGSPLKAAASEKGELASAEGANYNDATTAYANVSEATLMWQQQLDRFAIDASGTTYDSLPEGGKLASIVKEVLDIVPEAGPEEQVQFVARKVFYHMFEISPNSLHVQASAAALSLLKGRLPGRFPTDLTGLWTGLAEDRKWRKDVAEALLRARLLNGPDMDAHLSKVLQLSRSSTQAVEFAVHLVRNCITSERPCLTAAEFYHTLEVLQKLIVPQVPSNVAFGLQQLIDNALSQHHVPAVKLNDTSDPQELKDQVKRIFDEWIRISEDLPSDESHDSFVAGLQQIGFLKGDDSTNRFLRIMINLAVSHSLKHEAASQQPTQLSYLALDGFVRLIVLLVNVHSGGVPLLERVMANLMRCLQRDAELRSDEFNGRPYYRIILGFIQEMGQGPVLDANAFGLLSTVATALLSVQPLQTPSFAFPWLELISHRIFMPKLVNDQQGWPHFQKLLIALLRFLEPYLRNAELTDSVRLLYKGTLRVLLVLLHDFPEFLCEYHFEVCNAVPPSCIQMRNLILSAFPRNMRLPDPFTPNLKVDLLPEIGTAPRFRPPAESMLPISLQAEVDSYISQRTPPSFLAGLHTRLVLPTGDVTMSGTKYNVPLLNALVFYVGIQEVKSQRQVQPGASPVMHTPAMDIFQRMANDLDTEGRYLFLNALANQLRYPNNHTHYFSCILLYLFSEAKQEIIQEQITRVLLERLIVNRPHPWGLLITFIELIKNPRYSFWSYNFTRCAGEIERLFDSVARSCMGTGVKPEEEGQAVS